MINTIDKNLFIAELEKIVGSKSVLKTKWSMESYCKGWRYGEGEAIAVAKPSTLTSNLENFTSMCREEYYCYYAGR